ncbi:MAG: YebC/PmpR family DNA-binding transcriptional regulator [Gammaproteobacteria bacterium]|jgi:YebC/PmpR family DNA-binding regulatory protein|nr:YebC/PmpR family DNA-binding transcriptional regulator [Gammaproteobacteria bacterium]
MAGHSKWANIQHRKKAQDNKRGKLFTRLIREITVAARMGGSDLNSNSRLRLAMDKGLSANMTKDTVERAIKRGAGELDGDNYEEVQYEGYGPGGAAILVDCMTDNRNRTVAEVRHAFSKFNGNLGTSGSVAYMFASAGVIQFAPGTDEDAVMEVALESGAEDVVTSDDGSVEVITTADNFIAVKEAIQASALTPEQAEVTMRASTTASLSNKEGETMLRLLDALDELDDVQNVFSNADIPDSVFEAVA